ncbi:MAG: NADH-quinone oxidoreductase subunit N [Phycisphaerales bacterium]|nr:MAG: NADH-quinone oxidoreductase subunit N [Phycisphaerales bacterium]
MSALLVLLAPEIVLFITTCIVMIVGLWPKLEVRSLAMPIAGMGLLIAGVLAINTPANPESILPNIIPYAKAMTAGVGLMLVLLLAGTVDRSYEAAVERGELRFNPIHTNRAEFFAFFLFSLTGLMLCASATDLIWLFLALELVSLPTYVMATISTRKLKSQEAGVKYFFLGALGAAIFLYGFALLYGGTGTTNLIGIRDALAEQAASGGINPIAMAGIILSLIGISFKIAAVPMHFYTADVYQGAAAPVSAMLAFVPKTAGFIAMMGILAAVGWQYAPGGEALAADGVGALPRPIYVTLAAIAVLTMTVGNVLALLQRSIKRLLAYSSIAHTGYMLVALIAGPSIAAEAGITSNGLGAVLFYLLVYGVTNIGAFAVVACLERPQPDGEADELDDLEDLRGLCRTRPVLGWVMVICALGLLGLPPLLGFWAKFLLFTSAISAGEIALVVILGLNSAIAAFYYLKLVALPLLEEPEGDAPATTPFASRTIAGVLSAALVLLAIIPTGIVDAAMEAADRAGTIVPANIEAIERSITAEALRDEPTPIVDR